MTFKNFAIYAAAVTTGAAVAIFGTPKIPVNPQTFHIVWSPGDYSNFVVVTSTDLVNWQTYLVTTETNFQFAPNEPQRFWALYGTNSDGDSAWAGRTP